MKLKIVSKKDSANIQIIDMSAVCMARQYKGEMLELYIKQMPDSLCFNCKDYSFFEIEHTVGGYVSYVPRTIPEIVTLYAIDD